jgi:hypothetical protein
MPKAGELWLAEIPFTSGMASKLRPVLVLWEDMQCPTPCRGALCRAAWGLAAGESTPALKDGPRLKA